MRTKFRQKLLGKLNWLDAERVQDYFSQLAREKGFFEAVFNSLAEGVIVADADGRITYLNEAATELLGVPQETALGLALRRYLPDLKWDAAGNGSPRVFSREMEVFYPQRRYLHLHAVPLTAAGGGTVLILRDVTAARQRSADAIASERNEAVSLLAAGVAHEIGNPLNSLNIHLQLLDRETRDLPADKRAAFKESVRVARAEVARLDKIINDFLRAARPAPPRRRNKRRVGADVKRLGRLSERPLWQRQERRLSSTRRTHSNAEAVGRGRVIREMDFTVCASVKTWVVEE
jgi:PAS domain S-box-containing protein